MTTRDATRERLTPWYPHEIKPVRVGLYQASIYREGNPTAPKMLWDGKQWWHPINERPCDHQDRVWRGLARKP